MVVWQIRVRGSCVFFCFVLRAVKEIKKEEKCMRLVKQSVWHKYYKNNKFENIFCSNYNGIYFQVRNFVACLIK